MRKVDEKACPPRASQWLSGSIAEIHGDYSTAAAALARTYSVKLDEVNSGATPLDALHCSESAT